MLFWSLFVICNLWRSFEITRAACFQDFKPPIHIADSDFMNLTNNQQLCDKDGNIGLKEFILIMRQQLTNYTQSVLSGVVGQFILFCRIIFLSSWPSESVVSSSFVCDNGLRDLGRGDTTLNSVVVIRCAFTAQICRCVCGKLELFLNCSWMDCAFTGRE